MYPLHCVAGYPLPVKKGKFEVCHVLATVNSVGTASRLVLTDSEEGIIGSADDPAIGQKIIDLKGGTSDTVLEWVAAEPIKVRNGVTVAINDNVLAGSIFVYVR